MNYADIAVIGAGVIGLSTATLAQTAFPTAKVSILADKFLSDTTSHVAAGLFRPSSSFQGPDPKITRRWVEDSFRHYNGLLKENPEEAKKAGIMEESGHILSRVGPHVGKNPLLEGLLGTYHPCNPQDMYAFPGYTYGVYFTTLLVECTRYLPYLTEKFRNKGGKILRRKVQSFEEIAPEFDLVFNCSGLGARWLCKDEQLHPVRGQVYKVKAPWVKTFLYDEFDTYIIPGFDMVTMGGCRHFDSWSSTVDRYDSASIWDRCTRLLPSLKQAEVVKECTGLRPYRHQVRVELERLDLDGGRSLLVVHNYGHGGHGIATAPGTSMYAVQLAADAMGQASYRSML